MAENQIFEGDVQEFGTSSSGNTKIKIGGQWFYAGNVDTTMLAFGDRVSIEWRNFTPPGRPGDRRPPITLKMIQSWGKLPQQMPQPDRGPQRVNPAAPQQPTQATTQTPPPPQQPTRAQLEGNAGIMDADYIRLISNVMAALATGGKIETPKDVGLWYAALHAAVRGVSASTEPEFDDNIPY